MGLQGIQGEKGDKGDPGEDGASFVWMGEFASAPADAQAQWVYFNTTTGNAYIYNGWSWNMLARSGASGVSVAWQGEGSSPPPSPQLNWAYYNSADKISYIYNGFTWVVLAKDGAIGQEGPQGETGDTGPSGTSVVWKGEYDANPADPQPLWAYFNTTDWNAYIYNGWSWDTLAQSGASGASIEWKGELSLAPDYPQLNWAYYNTADKKLYIYDGSAWAVMLKDGEKGETGDTGNTGPAGASVVWMGEYPSDPSDPQPQWVYFNTTTGNAYIYNGWSWNILAQSGASIEWKGELSSAPPNPQLNWAYYNSNDKKSYIHDGSTWQILAQDGEVGPEGPKGTSIVWKGESAAPPDNPQLNWDYYNTGDKKSYIYNGSAWTVLAKDGAAGNTGADGISIVWKGEQSSAPAGPQLNWAYYNTADKKSYIYNGSAWQTLAQDGTAGNTGADGISLVWKGELSSAPASPQLNWAYYNTADKKSSIYNGSAWQILAQDGPAGNTGADGISLVWKGEQSSAPASPQLNWAYYNTGDKKSYIYNGSNWQTLAQDGAAGNTGADGISIVWKGELPSAPTSPQLNWAYYNTADKKSYIYNGSNWQILAQDGPAGPTGNTGADGISLVWKGELSSAPANPQLNWAYYNTGEKKSWIYNGSNWVILVKDGEDRAPVDHITVTPPAKTIYYEGESLATAGMIIYAVYADGTVVSVVSGYTLSWEGGAIQDGSIINITQPGTKTVTVTWQGHTAGFTLIVLPVINTTEKWTQALAEISADSDGTNLSPRDYTLNIQGSVSVPGVDTASVTGNYKTVRLTGSGTLSLSSQGRIFYISNNTHQTLIIDGPTLSGWTDNYGTVVLVGGGGTVEFLNGTISGNTNNSVRGYGGGVYVGTNGTFTMSGGTISDNIVSTADDGYYYGQSGGVGVYVDTNGTFIMSGGTISDNTVSTVNNSSYGGGVYVNTNGTFTMSGGTISRNTNYASGIGHHSYGGGVYVNSNGTFTMSGGTISNNTSGGVCVLSRTFTMSGGTISNNTGGGVWVNKNNLTSGTFTMSGGTISNNTGGGVRVDSGTFTMSRGAISNNIGCGVSVSDGGAFTMWNGIISGNTSASEGGGVYVSFGTFTMWDGTISNNTINGSYGSGGGGGVYVTGSGAFTMWNGTISGNTASYGGGVYVTMSATFTMIGGTISNNTASEGGGVFVGVIVSGPTLFNGIFTKTGGTVYGDTDNDFTNYSTDNTATSTTNAGTNGHAVYMVYKTDINSSNDYYYRNETLGNYSGYNISTTDTLPTTSGETMGNWTKR
jgi:hypothetical protein